MKKEQISGQLSASNMSKQEVVIIGLGWLGSRVYKHLQELNISVSGTYHTNKPRTLTKSYQFNLGNKLPEELLGAPNYLILVAPRLRNKNEKEIQHIISNHYNLINQLPENAKVLYTSSTSVYSQTGEVTEESLASGPISEIEDMIRSKFKNHLIFRLGGLAGEDRYIVNYLAKKGIITASENNTNLIHVRDVVSSILHGMKNNVIGTFNLCAKEHPKKGDVYLKWSKKLLNKKLELDHKSLKNKVVSTEKWLNKTKRKQIYPNPIFFDFDKE